MTISPVAATVPPASGSAAQGGGELGGLFAGLMGLPGASDSTSSEAGVPVAVPVPVAGPVAGPVPVPVSVPVPVPVFEAPATPEELLEQPVDETAGAPTAAQIIAAAQVVPATPMLARALAMSASDPTRATQVASSNDVAGPIAVSGTPAVDGTTAGAELVGPTPPSEPAPAQDQAATGTGSSPAPGDTPAATGAAAAFALPTAPAATSVEPAPHGMPVGGIAPVSATPMATGEGASADASSPTSDLGSDAGTAQLDGRTGAETRQLDGQTPAETRQLGGQTGAETRQLDGQSGAETRQLGGGVGVGVGVGAAGSAARGEAAAPVPAGAVSQQVFGEVSRLVSRGDGTRRITIKLSPEALGDVRVVLTVRQGEVHVRMAGSELAQQALLQGASELHRLLDLAGATTSHVVVGEQSSTLGNQLDRQAPQDEQGRQQNQDHPTAGTRDGDSAARDGAPREAQPRLPSHPAAGNGGSTRPRTAGVDVTM